MPSLSASNQLSTVSQARGSRSVVQPCCSAEVAGNRCRSTILHRREALAAALLTPALIPPVRQWQHASAGLLQDLFRSKQQEGEPIYFPRKPMNQTFAVLLLRSVYDAADAMDFVAMDEYQKQFWKLRQNEYEPYLQRLKPLPIRQGDLSDPLYFDFISFAQFATLNEELQHPKQSFQEYCEECPDQQRTIARCAELSDAVLPATLQQQAGDRIYAGLQAGFRGLTFDAPAPCSPNAPLQDLAGCVQRLLDVFVRNGFASKADVLHVAPHRNAHSVHWHGAGASGGNFTVQLERPSNLWGLGRFNLASQDVVSPSFDAMTVAAFLKASGCKSEHSIHRESTRVLEEWTVHA